MKNLIKVNWFYSENQKNLSFGSDDSSSLILAPNGIEYTEVKTNGNSSNFDDAILVYSALCERDEWWFKNFGSVHGDTSKMVEVVFDITKNSD